MKTKYHLIHRRYSLFLPLLLLLSACPNAPFNMLPGSCYLSFHSSQIHDQRTKDKTTSFWESPSDNNLWVIGASSSYFYDSKGISPSSITVSAGFTQFTTNRLDRLKINDWEKELQSSTNGSWLTDNFISSSTTTKAQLVSLFGKETEWSGQLASQQLFLQNLRIPALIQITNHAGHLSDKGYYYDAIGKTDDLQLEWTPDTGNSHGIAIVIRPLNYEKGDPQQIYLFDDTGAATIAFSDIELMKSLHKPIQVDFIRSAHTQCQLDGKSISLGAFSSSGFIINF